MGARWYGNDWRRKKLAAKYALHPEMRAYFDQINGQDFFTTSTTSSTTTSSSTSTSTSSSSSTSSTTAP